VIDTHRSVNGSAPAVHRHDPLVRVMRHFGNRRAVPACTCASARLCVWCRLPVSSCVRSCGRVRVFARVHACVGVCGLGFQGSGASDG
jgi:hypothetical protein